MKKVKGSLRRRREQNNNKLLNYMKMMEKRLIPLKNREYLKNILSKNKYAIIHKYYKNKTANWLNKSARLLNYKILYKLNYESSILSLARIERRLDVILYRSNLTHSLAHARQLILKKKVYVNNNIIDNYYLVKDHDVIYIDDLLTINKVFVNPIPQYMIVDAKLNIIIILRLNIRKTPLIDKEIIDKNELKYLEKYGSINN